MIEKKEKKGNITIYYVKKDYDDDKLKKIMDKKLKRSDITDFIDDNADVYNEDGQLLLKFRKNKLKKNDIEDFYDNVIDFAMKETSNRGSATGSKKKNIYDNPRIMTNIMGYYDKLSPKQKIKLRNLNKKPISVRETHFLRDHPEKFKKMIPLIEDVDKYYNQYIPDKYKLQKKKANQTPFHITNTAFTTITTNVNFQTNVHTDKGDDEDGFGNLTVIEKGKYTGGETCLPQYGIGVDVRTGDILYMDVHQAHGNLPIQLETKDTKRLSIVCYLRRQIWEKTKGKTKKFMIQHNKTMKNIFTSKDK